MFCCRPYSVVRCCSRGADVNVAQRVTTVSVLRHFSVAIVTEWLIFCESVANERYDHNDVTWLCSVGLEEMHCSACSLAVHPGSGLVPDCMPPDGWWFRWNTNWTIRVSLGVTRMDIGQDQEWVHQRDSAGGTVWGESTWGQTEVVWTCTQLKKDAGYIGRWMLTMELPGKRKRGKKEVYGCDKGEHDSHGCDAGRRRGENRMEMENPLWRPLTGAAERRRLMNN